MACSRRANGGAAPGLALGHSNPTKPGRLFVNARMSSFLVCASGSVPRGAPRLTPAASASLSQIGETTGRFFEPHKNNPFFLNRICLNAALVNSGNFPLIISGNAIYSTAKGGCKMLRTAFLTGAAVLALGAAYPARAQTLYRCVPDEQRVMAPDRLVSVEITLKPNGEFASIVYRAANGAVYDRAKQYEATSSQDRTGQHYWAGTLRANPNVAMVGSLNRIGDRLVYFETIHDKLQGGKVVSQVTSSCEPIVAEATPPPASAAPARPVSLPDRKIVLDCGASTVLVGETERNGVVATTVSHDPVRSSWSVIHHLADSTVVARETQYSMVDASQGVGAGAWAGYLNRNHNLQMIGRLTIDKQSDGLVYEEFLYDRGHGDRLIMHSQTNCAPTTTVFQSTPPTLQPSAPASISRGNSVPIYFDRDGRAVFKTRRGATAVSACTTSAGRSRLCSPSGSMRISSA